MSALDVWKLLRWCRGEERGGSALIYSSCVVFSRCVDLFRSAILKYCSVRFYTVRLRGLPQGQGQFVESLDFATVWRRHWRHAGQENPRLRSLWNNTTPVRSGRRSYRECVGNFLPAAIGRNQKSPRRWLFISFQFNVVCEKWNRWEFVFLSTEMLCQCYNEKVR